MALSKFRVQADSEIIRPEDDLLGYSAHAQKLAELIGDCQPPLVVAIKGPWGSGKSSFINLAAQKLRSDSKTRVIEFDAWKYRQEKNLALPLLARLHAEYKKEAIPGLVNLWKGMYGGVLISGTILAQKYIGLQDIKSILKDSDKLVADYEGYVASVENNNNNFSKIVSSIKPKEEGGRIVVVIENLDRCLPDYVLDFLEQLQIFFKVKGVVFVLPIDAEMIGIALSQRFGNITQFDAASYLDKIIDVYLLTPNISRGAVVKYAVAKMSMMMASLSEKEKSTLDGEMRRLESIFVTRESLNLRRINKALNALVTCIVCDEKSIARASSLFCAIYIQLYYPKAVEWMHSNKNEFIPMALNTSLKHCQAVNTSYSPNAKQAFRERFNAEQEELISDPVFMDVLSCLCVGAPNRGYMPDHVIQSLSLVSNYTGLGNAPNS